MAFAGYLVRGIVNDAADPDTSVAYMNTPQMKKFLRSKCKNIVGMANINAKEFQAIPIPKPPSTSNTASPPSSNPSSNRRPGSAPT